jgi:hypothetical protein
MFRIIAQSLLPDVGNQNWALYAPGAMIFSNISYCDVYDDRLCGLVVRVPGYRSRGPGSIPGATRFSWEPEGLERAPLGLVITTEELLKRKYRLQTKKPRLWQ